MNWNDKILPKTDRKTLDSETENGCLKKIKARAQ